MPGAFTIATIRGIRIRLHFSFLLVLPLLAWMFGRVFLQAAEQAGVPAGGLAGTPLLWGLVVALGLFLAVLVHELSHAFVALHAGGKVRDITLLMIGGVTQMTEPPSRPLDEAVMALAGPVTSLLLGALLFGAWRAADGTASFDVRFALFHLAQLNLLLGLFNLLPAFPMDGGRVVRSLLAGRMGAVRGTRFAAGLGKGFAVLFAAWGLATVNIFLLLIAWFVYAGADSEARGVVVRSVLGRIAIRELMEPGDAAADGSDTLAQLAGRMLRERRLSYPVVEAGSVAGVVTLQDVRRVPVDRHAATPVRDVMRRAAGVSPADEVWEGLRVMERDDLAQLPVVDEGRLVGTLRREDVARGLQLHELEAMRREPREELLLSRREAHP